MKIIALFVLISTTTIGKTEIAEFPQLIICTRAAMLECWSGVISRRVVEDMADKLPSEGKQLYALGETLSQRSQLLSEEERLFAWCALARKFRKTDIQDNYHYKIFKLCDDQQKKMPELKRFMRQPTATHTFSEVRQTAIIATIIGFGCVKDLAQIIATYAVPFGRTMFEATLELLPSKSNSLAHIGINSLNGVDCLTTNAQLDLSDNFIDEIAPGEISGLRKVEHLYLSRNDLSNLPRETLPLQLTGLDLAYNQLINVPADIYHMNKLRQLDLRGNKISVIQLQQLKEWWIKNNRRPESLRLIDDTY